MRAALKRPGEGEARYSSLFASFVVANCLPIPLLGEDSRSSSRAPMLSRGFAGHPDPTEALPMTGRVALDSFPPPSGGRQ